MSGRDQHQELLRGHDEPTKTQNHLRKVQLWRAAPPPAMLLVRWCGLLALCAAKPRELFEIGPEDREVGLDPFYEGNMVTSLQCSLKRESC